MATWLKRIVLAGGIGLAMMIAGAFGPTSETWLDTSAQAQQSGNVPGQAQGNRSDAEIWRRIRRGVQGGVSIPDRGAGVLIQSEGDSWRAVRNGPVSVYGGWMLLAVLIILALFFIVRGRMRIEVGFSGRTVERFNGVERFAHWMTATSFCVLGLTGLNTLYGRYVIKPWLGPEAFSTLSAWSKYAHNFIAFAFMVGLVMILVLWVRENILNRYDLIWLAKGGGLFSKHVHPPAKKFNAGQKILFWLVILAGGSVSFTGIALMFPFELAPFSWSFGIMNAFGLDLPIDLSPTAEMQLSQLWHAILALILIAVIIAHIYIGSLGMVGAFDAMGTGQVDENWAREHHNLWASDLGLGPGGRKTESGDDG
jgi:formate dehydrogenase subunit gamma